MAAAELAAAAGRVSPEWAGRLLEGPHAVAVITPGSIQLKRRNLARTERTTERAELRREHVIAESVGVRHQNDAHAAAREIVRAGLSEDQVPDDQSDPLGKRKPSREVTEWSRKSRANMVRRLVSLDYRPLYRAGPPALITLTMPGNCQDCQAKQVRLRAEWKANGQRGPRPRVDCENSWQPVAPTGKAFKALVFRWQRRFVRAWGVRPRGIWKLELQHRGAPHLHILMVPPAGRSRDGMTFREWLSWSWADVVAHPDPEQRRQHLAAGTAIDYREGLQCTDPHQVAVYFTKHNTMRAKEYQHNVPREWQGPGDGPGRFWGVWDLEPVEVLVNLTHDQAITIGRALRRWFRAKNVTHIATTWRVDQDSGRMRVKLRRRRLSRLPASWGFASVNDGPALAMMLARVIG